MAKQQLNYLKCSFPNCHNTVGQHSARLNKNMQVCHAHRKTRKNEIDKWKLEEGCANKDGKYGFPCVCKTFIDPATLDINHIDGDNMNRNPENIEVLCKMCHTLVTLKHDHHLQDKKNNRRAVFANTDLFDFPTLINLPKLTLSS